jgi:hypothetical protein
MTQRFKSFRFPLWVTVLLGFGVLAWSYSRTWPFPAWVNYAATEPIEIRGSWEAGKGLVNEEIVYWADGQRVPDPLVRFDVRRLANCFIAGPTEAGGRVRVRGTYYYTPCYNAENILDAIVCQHYRWVWLLPSFNIEKMNRELGTPPVIAALGNLEKLKLLLKRGADVNAKDVMGRTALFSAQTPEEARELVAAGASVEARDTEGSTPLMMAAHRRDLNAIRALLAVGANPNARDKTGYTALMAAARPTLYIGDPPGRIPQSSCWQRMQIPILKPRTV